MTSYRKLAESEIAALVAAGCSAEDWAKVSVAEGFDTAYIRNVEFSGEVKIGSTDHVFSLTGGMKKHSGIRNAALHDVTVGNGCFISGIHNYIANYTIGDNCYIENVGIIAVDGECTFGNGVQVSVLNETGGREVTMFDKLTSHQAYMSALYRHRPQFNEKLDELVAEYVQSVKSSTGTIGNNVMIVNTQAILGVKIGDGATVEGTSRLKNGTIASKMEAPVEIGHGVVCEDFIVCSGSSVEDGAMMTRCFVGQACK